MKRPGLLIVTIAMTIAATGTPPARAADVPPVHVVLFTHVEDNTPGGTLGTTGSRNNYLLHRSNFIAMAAMAESTGIQWTLQPDWKLLEAALLYEDAALKATTDDKNFLRYLKEDRGVVIDPHSHENGGYNYTDVAHLLDSLGVGATTVIGGHVWDPSLPQFQEWDRFRAPVAGEHYPGASWRGDILMGSGTPNHVNDPLISGVWRPRDRDHYFEHDPAGNIAACGSYKKSIASIGELISLRRAGVVPATAMLTFSTNINPSTLAASGGLAAVRDTVYAPLVAWRDSGLVVDTDFTTLIATWESQYDSYAYIYDAEAGTVNAPVASPASPAGTLVLEAPVPNPVHSAARIGFSLASARTVRLTVHDLQGRVVATITDGVHAAGQHTAEWRVDRARSGAYLCRVESRADNGVVEVQSRKLLVLR